MIFNFRFGRKRRRHGHRASGSLCDLRVGERAIVGEMEMAPSLAEHLMNLGLVPGFEVTVARSCPGGDPRIYRVDGTEIAMRRDLSRHIHVHLLGAPAFGD
jgi:ferrous iron transport protein A